MEFTAQQISVLLQGELVGNPNEKVSTLSKIEEGTKGSITFLANPKYTPYIYSTQASVVVVSKDFVPEEPIQSTLIKVADPYKAFANLLDQYQKMQEQNLKGIEEPCKIHSSVTIPADAYVGSFAYISEGVKMGSGCKIYPNVFIGKNVVLGNNVILHPNAIVYHDCIIGSNVIIHSGSVVGSDGFGFAPQADGSYSKIPQIGNVILEDDVEIGSNTTIDRATMGSTIIKKGVKLDNLIQIAHNAEIGQNTVIASQTGISGSTKIAENCVIGGQVGVVGHISIAKGTKINAKTGINKSITEENQALNGVPAMEYRHSLKTWAVLKKLPELEKKIQDLELLLKDLKQNNLV
jgi:UDP-3-O-[3-hydroxymyristoyl] glucosamine N-acyltransferase